MRIPRKKKKKYKKIWSARRGREIIIQKKSISNDCGFWGCIVYFKGDKVI